MERHFYAIVVGSGPGGSTAVRELTEAGMDVLLLEAGPERSEAEFVRPEEEPGALGMDIIPRAKDMLIRGQVRQACRAFFDGGVSPFMVNDLEDPYTTPLGQSYLWIRSKMLGGRMQTYGRVLQRMGNLDFKAASLDGYGEDWPIEYADLEPYYDRVEELVGVYGDKDGLDQPADGKYIGPGFLSTIEKEFKAKVETRWPERKVISWRVQAPFEDRIPPGIAAARRTGRLVTRTNAVVSRITVNPRSGLASGAEFVDRVTKRRHRVFGDVVVLAASTIESIRLLLNSGTTAFPDGLANSSGLLGHYFMDQTTALCFADVPDRPGSWDEDTAQPADSFHGRAGGILIPRFQNLDGRRTERYLRGFDYQGIGGRSPVPPDVPAVFGGDAMGEMLPRYDNYVGVSRRVKDKWGIPAPRIDCTLSANERMMTEDMMKAIREMVEYAGYRINFIGSTVGLDSSKVWPDFNPLQRQIFKVGIRMSQSLGAAIHECGGARMGSDPKKSVVNNVNQTWDIPNLFVTDASSFVTNGTVGPTLTIMALTSRACKFIAEQHASGGLTRPTELAAVEQPRKSPSKA
ncbi:GMC family oxidoreductase [Actinomyces ruminis]|uniref:GMC family oxidoreductase n=1 Tax=Actinomyces ruminis TaxID=1937003 RepID=A0ABX4M8B2_9ACTO|nr:GMC family oxidoreductase [Actinomyces ruminis]